MKSHLGMIYFPKSWLLMNLLKGKKKVPKTSNTDDQNFLTANLYKDQIKSGWNYEDIDFPNYHLKYLMDFCPESFEVEYL